MCAQPAPATETPSPPPRPPRAGITPIQWVGLGVLILLFLYQFMGPRLANPATALAFLNAALPRFVALVLAITVHEFSHGFVATLFGDDLPRRIGRLTLNPLKHLDPIGTLMILIGPIGWGRPMLINPAGMRNPSLGWALSSVAGPVSNIVAAAVVGAIYAVLEPVLAPGVFRFVDAFMVINILLAVFNLVPVPPLDGFGFLYGLSPRPLKIALQPLRAYGFLILLAVLFLPPLRAVLDAFMGAGLGLVLPPMEGLCQCRL